MRFSNLFLSDFLMEVRFITWDNLPISDPPICCFSIPTRIYLVESIFPFS